MADSHQEPTAENMTMLQGFEWYVPADQKHWVRLEKHVPQLKAWGIDNVWLPPGFEQPGCLSPLHTG
jgi:alpha-amylase